VRPDIDEQQSFRVGLGMFLLGENYPAIVSHGAGVQSGKLTAQVMGLQTRVGEIFSHAAERGFNLRLQRGMLGSQTAEGALKLGREGEFAHGSLGGAETGDDGVGGRGFEFARAEIFGGGDGFGGSFGAPIFNAAVVQQFFQHGLFFGGERSGAGQHPVKS
jgi:hypothetical protein